MSTTSHDIPGLITYESVEIRGPLAFVTFSIPYDLLKSFQTLLSKFLLLVSFVTLKARHSKCIQAPDPAVISFNEARIKQFHNRVLSLFDESVSKGALPREAARSVRDSMNQNGKVIDCYMVELIVRAAGRLSKKRKVNNA